MQNSLLAAINNLSASERLILVEEIWDHLADTNDAAISLSEAQCAELDRRIEKYKDNADAGRYWHDVKDEYFRSNR